MTANIHRWAGPHRFGGLKARANMGGSPLERSNRMTTTDTLPDMGLAVDGMAPMKSQSQTGGELHFSRTN